jgi:hypothetical protein
LIDLRLVFISQLMPGGLIALLALGMLGRYSQAFYQVPQRGGGRQDYSFVFRDRGTSEMGAGDSVLQFQYISLSCNYPLCALYY